MTQKNAKATYKRLEKCMNQCGNYYEIVHDQGIALYCSYYERLMDEELVNKCNKMLKKKFKKLKGRYYFVR